ncbi:MAG: DUF1365 domain-containing protein [Kiritimatiellia bacterium]
MHSRIYSGQLAHARLQPVPHAFRTGLGFLQLDLTELEQLDREIPGFGFNRFAPVSLCSRHYLRDGNDSFAAKLAPWVGKLELNAPPSRISLVTCPRWWGRIFNPVSFYLLRDAEDECTGLIAEVNNTFGDRHIYPVRLEKKDGIFQSVHDKEFHVSPFNDMQGAYHFSVREDGDQLYIGVDLYKDGKKFLLAWMEGEGEKLTGKSLWKHYLRHPLRPWLTLPRIVWQAVLLRYRRKLTVFKRPEPSHPHTLFSRSQPVPPAEPPEEDKKNPR